MKYGTPAQGVLGPSSMYRSRSILLMGEKRVTSSKKWAFIHDSSFLGPLSHMRLRAREPYTSSTLIRGKGGAGGPSSLHTMLERPSEYVKL